MGDLISVIVPVYNVETYLSKCVESIMVQTYINLEIILVDDGSPDNCGQMCDEFASRDSRIKVIHKENGGLSDARNAGISASKGNYIVFIDSDDYVAPEYVESLYKSIVDNNTDLAICNLLCVDDTGAELKSLNEGSPVQSEVITSTDLMEIISRENNGWYYVVAWNKIYKRELFKDILFPVGKINEDEFVIHKFLNKCKTVSCISEPLYFYVKRRNSIMNESYNVKKLDVCEAYLERIQFFTEQEMYGAAMNTVKKVMFELAKAKKCLDLRMSESKSRYKVLKDNFKEIFLGNLIHHVSLKEKISMCIYFLLGATAHRIFCSTYAAIFKYKKG